MPLISGRNRGEVAEICIEKATRKGSSMPNCQHCKYAEWDYDDFDFGGHVRQWFLTGCRKEVEDIGGCEEGEEATEDE